MAEPIKEPTPDEMLALDWSLDAVQIMKYLPHRPPFLMVDRVTGIVDKQYLHGFKLISHSEPPLLGHFPGMPVFPGVLQIEALAQMGGLFAVRASGRPLDDTLIYLLSLDDVKFRRPVVPGDRLDLRAWLIKRKGPMWRMGGQATVEGQVACECTLLAFVGSKEEVMKKQQEKKDAAKVTPQG
jgi:3-hydroxyacyl-[acyl-carrier-protein] dehydratase